jgi:hypothetical protein
MIEVELIAEAKWSFSLARKREGGSRAEEAES